MDSARTYRSSSTRKLSVSIETGQYSAMESAFQNAQSKLKSKTEETEASEDSKTEDTTAALERLRSSQISNSSRIQDIASNEQTKSVEQIRQKCILYLWCIFFGKDKASEMADELGLENPFTESENTAQSDQNYSVITMESSEECFFEESESTTFSSVGCVRTSDGREINFNVDATMSRTFSEYYKENSVSMQVMCDPLVINLDDGVVGLSDQKFYFDLDMDGEQEEISNLQQGNGFLALDKNADGTINNGSELFGAASGNGFADLAQYDKDKNGWIDENDSVYDKLKIWVKNESGEDTLYSLKDKNIGAIYLGNEDTNFTLRSNGTGKINGEVRKTGIFLYEDGAVGTLSHLDIAN